MQQMLRFKCHRPCLICSLSARHKAFRWELSYRWTSWKVKITFEYQSPVNTPPSNAGTSRPHLLSAAVGGDWSLRSSSQCCSVVIEIAGRIHLVLWRDKCRVSVSTGLCVSGSDGPKSRRHVFWLNTSGSANSAWIILVDCRWRKLWNSNTSSVKMI